MSCCCKTIINTGATATDAQLTLFINPTALALGCVYNICYDINPENLTGGEYVALNDGTTDMPLRDKLGNLIQVGRLTAAQQSVCRQRIRLRLAYGNIPSDQPHFVVLNDVPICMSITPAAAAAEA